MIKLPAEMSTAVILAYKKEKINLFSLESENIH
jgi:hypothetical protein